MATYSPFPPFIMPGPDQPVTLLPVFPYLLPDLSVFASSTPPVPEPPPYDPSLWQGPPAPPPEEVPFLERRSLLGPSNGAVLVGLVAAAGVAAVVWSVNRAR